MAARSLWVHDRVLDPKKVEELELKHAGAVLRALEKSQDAEVMADILIALRRLSEVEEQSSLVAALARRGEQICRATQRHFERELILRTVVVVAWSRRDASLMEKFAGDLVTLYEEFDRIEEAERWRPRYRQMAAGQMWLPFGVSEE